MSDKSVSYVGNGEAIQSIPVPDECFGRNTFTFTVGMGKGNTNKFNFPIQKTEELKESKL